MIIHTLASGGISQTDALAMDIVCQEACSGSRSHPYLLTVGLLWFFWLVGCAGKSTQETCFVGVKVHPQL